MTGFRSLRSKLCKWNLDILHAFLQNGCVRPHSRVELHQVMGLLGFQTLGSGRPPPSQCAVQGKSKLPTQAVQSAATSHCQAQGKLGRRVPCPSQALCMLDNFVWWARSSPRAWVASPCLLSQRKSLLRGDLIERDNVMHGMDKMDRETFESLSHNPRTRGQPLVLGELEWMKGKNVFF